MYVAPVEEIAFTLRHVAEMEVGTETAGGDTLSGDVLDAILGEAGRFAGEVLAPLNAIGDRNGSSLVDGAVTTPPGWIEAYAQWCAGGWNSLSGPVEFGGQGLPTALSAAVQEMWNSAAMAFAVCPMLSAGAVEAIQQHGSDELKAIYLGKLVSGEWTATMNLTEPQAGTDLGAITTRAEPAGEGTYRLFGEKIFITYGEHDLTQNIVHTVLARLPDAPAGTRGISMFLAPKFLPGEATGPGLRNDIVCTRLEEKLGIHASPTCAMSYGTGTAHSGLDTPGAVGWLIGEENRGLNHMFTMMNNARLMVGIEGVGIAERATQLATAYAVERRQGRSVSWQGEGPSPIIGHPDVRRMLMTMRGLTAAARALCLACAHAIDKAGSDQEGGEYWRNRADLLTPIAKAFATDCGVEAASLGIQIHGGMGYIEESGAPQLLRDARIAPIYEGTNGVQAVDLVTRKLPRDGGDAVRAYLGELRTIVSSVETANRADLAGISDRLTAALNELDSATRHLLAIMENGRIDEALAAATPYLRLFGIATGGTLLAKGALATPVASTPAEALRVAVARAFAAQEGPAALGLGEAVRNGAAVTASISAEILSP